jgi:HK97 family phage major capsid protein
MDVNERIGALDETRQRVWNEAKGFLADLEGKEMNAEQRTQWDRYNERIDGLQSEITSLQAAEKREREDAALRASEARVFGEQTVKARDNVLASWLRGETSLEAVDYNGQRVNGFYVDIRTAAKEREILRRGGGDAELRDLAWDTGNVASAVPTTMARTLYEVLEAGIAGLRLPTTRISTDSGEPMEFPKVTTHAIATQVSGQGTTIGGTDPAFSKLSLTPVKYAQTIDLAAEVVTDTGVDVESFVSRDIGRAIARLVDEKEVARMVSITAGLGSTNTGGSLIGPSYDKLIDLVYSVNDAYRGRSAAWLFRDSTVAAVRKLRDGAGGTEGTPLWQPGFAAGLGLGQPASLLDYPVYTDPNVASMASNAIIGAFGDWAGFYLRTVGNPMIERNDSVGFREDQVVYRGKWRTIGGYQDTGAVKLLKQNV